MQIFKILVLIGFIAFLTACSSFSLAGDITPPPGSNLPAAQPTQVVQTGPVFPLIPPNPANGEPFYAENCAPCHGESGRGDGPQAVELPLLPAVLVSPAVINSATPAEWFTLISKGDLKRFMPPFNSLTERQRWDVIAYVHALAAPDEKLAEGQALYQSDCAECHGEEGRGDGPQASAFGGQMPDFTDLERMASTTNQALYAAVTDGLSPDMPAFDEPLSEDQRWSLVSFIRSLTMASSAKQTRLEGTPTTESEITPNAASTLQPGGLELQSGLVTGKLVSMSGDESTEGLIITLRGFDDMLETVFITTTVQSDGIFNFTDVDMPTTRAFVASTVYEGVIYGSDIVMIEDETASGMSLELLIPIFGSTTDPDVLSADRVHIFFDYLEPDSLRVIEIYIISNHSDRTLVPDSEGEATIVFDLPEGATNLQFEDGVIGERYMQTTNGFGDTIPIRPGSGQHQVTFGYEMPYDRKLDLAQTMNMPVNSVIILIPKDGLKIKGEQLEYAGARDVQGMTYEMYTSGRIEAGSGLTISVSGQPGGGDSFSLESNSTANLVVGLAAFGITLVVAGVWFYLRSRSKYTQEDYVDKGEEFNGENNDIPDDPEALMDAIIALDDLYQAGELPEDPYRQRRAVLKERLRELTTS